MYQILHRVSNVMLKIQNITKNIHQVKKNFQTLVIYPLAYCGSILSFFGILFPPQKKGKFDVHPPNIMPAVNSHIMPVGILVASNQDPRQEF